MTSSPAQADQSEASLELETDVTMPRDTEAEVDEQEVELAESEMELRQEEEVVEQEEEIERPLSQASSHSGS